MAANDGNDGKAQRPRKPRAVVTKPSGKGRTPKPVAVALVPPAPEPTKPAPEAPEASPVTPLSETEERFCREYVGCLNATEAYLRVFPDVKRTTAGTSGWKLLKKAEIEARVAELNADLRRQITERAVVDREWVIARLVENVDRALQAVPVLDKQGKATGEYTYQGSVANQALNLIGKDLGLFGDKLELTMPPEEAKRRIFELFTAAAQRRRAS